MAITDALSRPGRTSKTSRVVLQRLSLTGRRSAGALRTLSATATWKSRAQLGRTSLLDGLASMGVLRPLHDDVGWQRGVLRIRINVGLLSGPRLYEDSVQFWSPRLRTKAAFWERVLSMKRNVYHGRLHPTFLEQHDGHLDDVSEENDIQSDGHIPGQY